MPTPSPFSPTIPNLQIAWDSTSLRLLMECPYKYYLTIIQGWRGSGVDLEFGGLYAGAVEVFKKSLLAGATWEDAQLAAFSYAFDKSGYYLTNSDNDRWVPWGGSYVQQWRCTGTEKYHNNKGNPAKCPFSHKGVWMDGFAPGVCGECGSPTQEAVNWLPLNPAKDRYTLLRLVTWYCEEQKGSQVRPYSFPDGTPAVELSFRMPLPWTSPAGDPYILCGHNDSLVTFGDEGFVSDNKTTKKQLGPAYWAGYSPNVQVEIYDLAGSVLYQDLNLKGVLIEGAQVLVSGAKFGLGVMYRNDAQRNETLRELKYWIGTAEEHARTGYWPRNTASCAMCDFKKICSIDPGSREQYIPGSFTKRPWNPLEER